LRDTGGLIECRLVEGRFFKRRGLFRGEEPLSKKIFNCR